MAHLGIPLDTIQLDPQSFQEGNWEEQGRLARLAFFAQLYTDHNCQALLLGHQADDQAEVVLKRVFEGAHLCSLGGTLEEITYQGMKIWRPLLPLRKQSLMEWLQKRGLNFFEDETNTSSLFLRGRMRSSLLPH